MKPKRELIRVVRTPEEALVLDTTGKKSGRGAYLCKSQSCFALAQKGRKLERSFSCKVAPEVYEELEHALLESLCESADHVS